MLKFKSNSGLSLCAMLGLLLYYCSSHTSEQDSETVANGADLSVIYCSTCHDYPSPELLTKASWEEQILPRMGNMLGIYEDVSREELLEEDPQWLENIYPMTPEIEPDKWIKIKQYYLRNAPDSFSIPRQKYIISEDLTLFEIIKPNITFSPPSTTLVQFGENDDFFVGDAHSQSFFRLDDSLQPVNAANTKEGAVHLRETNHDYWITVMGSFSPNDASNGFIMKLPRSGNHKPLIPISNLNRPVHSLFVDLDNDQKEDIVVSEFGKWAGKLSIYKNMNNNHFEKSTLIEQTGAIRTEAFDFDGNGFQDIMSLFGQGNEGIYLSLNRGDDTYYTKKVLNFSPSHGSSYFKLYDYNQDGHADIIYTAGDDADFNGPTKPYHGLYIFINDGRNNFIQHLFYHIPGAYKAIPADFDLDGDIDFAVISFFPDYEESRAGGFTFLENNRDRFKARTFPDSEMGRWMVMDSRDYDKDGDEDLILGSLAFETKSARDLEERWINEGLPFIILKNTTHTNNSMLEK